MSEQRTPDGARPSADGRIRQASDRPENSPEPISQPGGFQNDPPDPTNPNEAIERHRRKLRP
jgi:hypothetical protein